MNLQWKKHIPNQGNLDDLFTQFKTRAEELTVHIHRVSANESLRQAILQQIVSRGAKKVVASPLSLVNEALLKQECGKQGIDLSLDLDREIIEKADIGISEFQLGIAETGTLFQDASQLHCRLVSMLPPTHLAIIDTQNLVPDMSTALEVIHKAYGNQIPPYLSFITGPSKTADIERVLTVGVHGPGRMSIIFSHLEIQS